MRLYFVLFLLFGTLIAEEAKPKKILYATVPKSGTHLLRKIIEMMTELETQWIPLSETPFFDPAKDLKAPGSITAIHLFPEIDLVRTHFSDSYTKVLLIRDPRDVMVSFAHHIFRKMVWFSCPQLDYHAFEKLSLDDQLSEVLLFPAIYNSPAPCLETAALWAKDPTVLVCRFEDLVGEQGGGSKERQQKAIKALAAHLKVDLSEEKLESIINNLFGGTWTFREGKIGAWKASYNKKNKELFKTMLGPSLIDLGYESHLLW